MFDLSGLNGPQAEAVLHDKGPLLILAGAGSGKTRVITHRIAYLIQEKGVSPFSILAITFTNKAANEMKERVERLLADEGLNVWVSTFHSSCVRMLRKYAEHIGYESSFTIYDSDDAKSLMKQVLKDLNIDTKRFKEKFFMNNISAAKNECVSAEEYASTAAEFSEKMVAKVYTEYQKRLRENNAFDFDDLLMKAVELLETCKEALDYYNRRFEYIMVDEYQDTNNAQFRLIKLLANHYNELSGEWEHNLCVVGDDDQSIYRFRGADITNILSFENTFHNAKVIKLEQNYRSTDKILEVANEVISNNRGRKDKKLWTEKLNGEDVGFIQYSSDLEEANGIATDIKKKADAGASYSSFAVLYRTNAQSRLLEERMIFFNIPYRIVGGVNFYQRMEVKDILAYLRALVNNNDALQFKRIANVPKRGIGDTTLNNIQAYADSRGISYYEAMKEAVNEPSFARAKEKLKSFINLIEGFRAFAFDDGAVSVKSIIEKIIDDTDYEDYLDSYDSDPDKADERKGNIGSLIDKAVAYEEEAGEEASLSDFLAEVSLVADIDSVNDTEDRVLLMTLHSAKGLEFDEVYMCGMEDGLFPSSMCMDNDNELEEERRLCYVGITRARKRLTFTCAKQRMAFGEMSFNPISRFVLREIPRHMLSIKGHAHEAYMKDMEEKKEERRRSFDSGRLFAKGPYENPYSEKIKVREVELPDSPALGYKEGDTVEHSRFGRGVVKEITKGKKDFEVTVEFEGGPKRMLASFAKLKKC